MTTKLSSESVALPARNVEAPTYVFESGADACKHVAFQVAGIIRDCNSLGRSATLGLVAGSSPVGVYQELVRFHEEQGLDFSRVSIFIVNEYYGLDPDRLQSMRRWLMDNFIRKTNLRAENVHFFDATIPIDQVEASCRQYENEILLAGGIDVMILGVAPNGAIGFNEPYTSQSSRTRLAQLDPETRLNAASLFFSETNVPTHGLTLGFGTIMESRKIVVLAFGDAKAAIIQRALEEPISNATPASVLATRAPGRFLYYRQERGLGFTRRRDPVAHARRRVERRHGQTRRFVALRTNRQGVAQVERRRFPRARAPFASTPRGSRAGGLRARL